MKKAYALALTLMLTLVLTGCNVFSWMEPTTNHFDRCKSLNDKGDYEGAIEACEKADPNDEYPEVQIELADAHLAALGIRIDALSEVFLDSDVGTDTIVSLAESLIDVGSINQENHTGSMEHATEAYEAFEAYGRLLVAQDPTDGPTIAAFYNTLAGISVVSVAMAYADIMSDSPNGLVEKADICNPLNPNCIEATQTIMCINDPADVPFYNGITCEGMLPADAAVAADKLIKLGINLSTLDLPGLEDAVDELVNISVLEPGGGTKKIGESAYQDDAGRELLRSIARD